MKPISPNQFGLTIHKMQQFSATVPGDLDVIGITDPELWTNVAPQCRPGDMIWVDADDYSFTARLKVTYSAGQRIRVVVMEFKQLEVIDAVKEVDENAPYFIKQRGPKKWCIIERTTGDVKKELIPTQLDAYKELDDYVRALAA